MGSFGYCSLLYPSLRPYADPLLSGILPLLIHYLLKSADHLLLPLPEAGSVKSYLFFCSKI